jgi:hypothetical protein
MATKTISLTPRSFTRTFHSLTAIAISMCLTASGGCSKTTQLEGKNRQLLESLRTATAAQRMDWLEATIKKATERQSAHGLSDRQFEALQAVSIAAHQGQWKTADQLAVDLLKGQQPTAEEIKRVESHKRRR